MVEKDSVTPYNQLLKSLPIHEQIIVENNSALVELRAGDILGESDQSPAYIYFPVSGLISLVVDVDDEPSYALAMVGRDGMLGASTILGIAEAPMKGIVQVAGQAVRIAAAAFENLAKDGTKMLVIVKRYFYALVLQLKRTAACSRFHDVSRRLARWLLMTHDRFEGDSFFLTQQYLSEILGVQRSAISIAASILQTNGFINYVRGQITILDRKGLEAVVCSCYSATVSDQLRVAALK